MLRENLKDSADILSNILNQSLEIPGVNDSISLLQAIQNYPHQQAEHSDLSKMLRIFASNPDPTFALIQELNLIVHDLTGF